MFEWSTLSDTAGVLACQKQWGRFVQSPRYLFEPWFQAYNLSGICWRRPGIWDRIKLIFIMKKSFPGLTQHLWLSLNPIFFFSLTPTGNRDKPVSFFLEGIELVKWTLFCLLVEFHFFLDQHGWTPPLVFSIWMHAQGLALLLISARGTCHWTVCSAEAIRFGS